MIRINLLPNKQGSAAQGAPSRRWIGVVVVALLINVVGLFVLHQAKSSELSDRLSENRQLQGTIDQIRERIKDHDKVKAALAELRAREEAIVKLEAGRRGPTAVMLELAQLLTPARGPSIDPEELARMRKENPLAVFNANWDSRRLWLTAYVESERVVRIEGVARDGNDVYELAQRMKISPYFQDVRLLPGKKEVGRDSRIELVTFALQAQVRY